MYFTSLILRRSGDGDRIFAGFPLPCLPAEDGCLDLLFDDFLDFLSDLRLSWSLSPSSLLESESEDEDDDDDDDEDEGDESRLSLEDEDAERERFWNEK